MFYCEECRMKKEWPQGFSYSMGVCEICGESNRCYDRPSSSLPSAKKPSAIAFVDCIKVMLDSLKPHPTARPLSEERVRYFEENIARLGQLEPLYITPLGFVVEGGHRLEAMKRLRYTAAWCKMVPDGQHPDDVVRRNG